MTLSICSLTDTRSTWDIAADLLSFLRCGLQYRYSRPGKPRPSHSSQQFSGQFLQQVLEDALLHSHSTAGPSFPWPDERLGELLDHVERRLAARGVRCHSAIGRHYTRLRAAAAVNELGPFLFPFLCHARLQVRSSRRTAEPVTHGGSDNQPSWELTATIHAVARLQLRDPAFMSHGLVKLLHQQLPAVPADTVEILVDFQGNRRPDSSGCRRPFEDVTQQQIQACSSLYSPRTPHSVIAGLVCYLSELVPSRRQFLALRKALMQRAGDPCIPAADSQDARILRTWKPGSANEVPPLLSLAFRLQRTLSIIPITSAGQQAALQHFDSTVQRIRLCRSRELLTGRIVSAWERNAANAAVCRACDARTWCPEHTPAQQPELPGIRLP